MADVKISALPLATTPLAGTEVLPIVQSATTDQVSVANLTAGRAVSAASLTLTTTPLAVGSGGTATGTAGIGAFNNITGYTASGATGTTSTNLVFSTSPSVTTPTFNTSATGPLFIGGTTASSSLTLKSTSGVGTSDAIIFQVGNNGATESMRILNDGGLTIGFPTKVAMGSFTPTSEIQASGASASFGIVRYVTPGGGGAIMALGSSRSAVGTGGTTALQSGDGCGSLNFYGADGTSLVNSVGAFTCSVDGAVSTGIVPTRLTFSTMSTAGASTERMRIDSSGNLLVGTTTASTILTVNGVATLCSGTATPAGGSTSARLLFGTTAGFGIYYGSGAPTVSAAQGSIYLRSDGSSTSTRLYINTNGSTTWTNVTTAA